MFIPPSLRCSILCAFSYLVQGARAIYVVAWLEYARHQIDVRCRKPSMKLGLWMGSRASASFGRMAASRICSSTTCTTTLLEMRGQWIRSDPRSEKRSLSWATPHEEHDDNDNGPAMRIGGAHGPI